MMHVCLFILVYYHAVLTIAYSRMHVWLYAYHALYHSSLHCMTTHMVSLALHYSSLLILYIPLLSNFLLDQYYAMLLGLYKWIS